MAIPDYNCRSEYENMNNKQVMMVVGSQVKSVRIPGHFFKTPHMSLFCSGTVLESAWNLAIFHSEQQEQWGKKRENLSLFQNLSGVVPDKKTREIPDQFQGVSPGNIRAGSRGPRPILCWKCYS